MKRFRYCRQRNGARASWSSWGWLFVSLALVCVLVIPSLAIAQDPILSAAEIDYPPFSIVDANGRAGGFSVELMRAALAAMGRDVTFRTGPWAEVRGWLEKGEVHALPLVGRTPEREHLLDFTFPYMSLFGAIVVRKDATDMHDLKDLRGRRVAVMKGDNAEEFLRREDRGIKIHTTSTFEEAMEELSKGHYDAVVIQRLVALRLIQKTGLSNLRVVNRPIEGFRQDFCFAVKEGDRETLALLNEGLALVTADGTFRHLHAKWFAALELPSHRRIVIGGDHNYPPYEYLDEKGRPTGYNVELTRAIAREMGIDIEIRLGPWNEIVEVLEKGGIDALQGMFYSPVRDLKFDFTPPHTVNHCIAVVRKGEGPPPDTREALTGKRIVVQQGDIMHDFARENGLEKQVSAVNTQGDALRELAEGKHDCALVSRLTAMYWIKKTGWKNLIIGQRSLLSPEYCYAVPNNHKALLAQLSEGLKVMDQNGEYRRIHQKWLGVYKEKPPSFMTALRYSAMALVPLGLILLASFLWSWFLRKQVATRTEALRESMEFQRAMIACSPVALYSMDSEGKVLTWNPSAERIFGWSAGEVVGRLLPIVPDVSRDQFNMHRREVMSGQGFVNREMIRQRKDGTRFPISLSVAPIRNDRGDTVGIMSAAEDITERKRAVEALKESELRYRTVARLSSDFAFSCIHTGDGGYAVDWITDAFYALTGISEAELRERQCWMTLTHPEDREAATEPMGRLQPGDCDTREFRIVTKDGRILTVSNHMECEADPGVPGGLRIYGAVQDITERKRAETERERLMAAVEQAGEIVLITDPEGSIQYVNPAFERVTGYTREEALGRTPRILKSGKQDETFYREMWETISGGRTWKGLIVNSRKDGKLYNEETTISPVCDASGRIVNYVAVKRDITEHLMMEAQFLQAQKLEAVGRLTGGIAHDFNNLLTPIIGNAEMALSDMSKEDPLYADMEEIRNAGARAASLTRQLLAFSRRQILQPELMDLNGVVRNLDKMLRRIIGEDVELETLLNPKLGLVEADVGQIEQILMNLAVNARDAMPRGGKLTVETSNVDLDEGYARNHISVIPGPYVMLAVSDTGVGMSKEVLEHLFEPFFTTKEKWKGTGLGLSTVYGIVKQSRGNIWVYSEPGQGSTFKVYLPRVEEMATGEEKPKGGESLEGSGTVLVVEDDEMVRNMTVKVLERYGYTVLCARGGEDAERICREQGEGIRLMVTDVVMPRMSGKELAERVGRIQPGMKVLFMSGYTDNAIVHHGVLDKGVAFIQKPFTLEGLARKVREVLGN